MKKVLILVFVSLFVLFTENAFADLMITNGGFEDGLTGWSSTNVAALGTCNYPHASNTLRTILPNEGEHQAVMSPQYPTCWCSYSDSDLWQEFSINPTLYTGATISFDYNLWAWDRMAGNSHETDDYLVVTYNTTELLRVPFNDDAEAYGAAYSSVLGWHTFSTTLPASELSGPLTLKFHLENHYLDATDPQVITAFIDNVSVDATPVPAPGAVVLGSIGIGLAGWLCRRRTP